jgi:hypothetical protein
MVIFLISTTFVPRALKLEAAYTLAAGAKGVLFFHVWYARNA